jgi:hypothetical protein
MTIIFYLLTIYVFAMCLFIVCRCDKLQMIIIIIYNNNNNNMTIVIVMMIMIVIIFLS